MSLTQQSTKHSSLSRRFLLRLPKLQEPYVLVDMVEHHLPWRLGRHVLDHDQGLHQVMYRHIYHPQRLVPMLGKQLLALRAAFVGLNVQG